MSNQGANSCIQDKLLIATCRSGPWNQADVALEAGKYELWLLDPRRQVAPQGQGVTSDCRGSLRVHRGEAPIDEMHVSKLPEGDVVIVIHGFNCTADTGIVTAANVRDSLCLWGQPVTPHGQSSQPGAVEVIGFTWPCEHTLFPGYMHDKATVARFAAFALANLLIDLRKGEGERRNIHIVAHSMGCFALVKALNMLAVLHELDAKLPIVDQVIWFAADLNADALERTTLDGTADAARAGRRVASGAQAS